MDERIYLIMDYCSGGDLSFYIKKRGRLPTLEYVPPEGGPKRYWIHPEEGGLDEVVVKCFLGQLSELDLIPCLGVLWGSDTDVLPLLSSQLRHSSSFARRTSSTETSSLR